MVDSPMLDQKERPGGTIHQNAMSIGWLQDALDYFHRKFPWTGTIASSAVSIVGGTVLYALPTDYTLDVRDGVRIMQSDTKRRLRRKPLPWLLNRDTTQTGTPAIYVVLGTNLRVWPVPDKAYTAELWYYQLPATLDTDDKPIFPDDWTLIEYIRLRGKEFTGEAQPGSAMGFAAGIAAGLQKSGLGVEGEDDQLHLDSSFFQPTGQGGGSSADWMGEGIVQ
jgi:hypothetical protein